MEIDNGTETQFATTTSQLPHTDGMIDISQFPSTMWGKKHPRGDSDFAQLVEQIRDYGIPPDPIDVILSDGHITYLGPTAWKIQQACLEAGITQLPVDCVRQRGGGGPPMGSMDPRTDNDIGVTQVHPEDEADDGASPATERVSTDHVAGDTLTNTEDAMNTKTVPIDSLKPNDINSKIFTHSLADESTHELAEGIRRHGLRQPIEVNENNEILDGDSHVVFMDTPITGEQNETTDEAGGDPDEEEAPTRPDVAQPDSEQPYTDQKTESPSDCAEEVIDRPKEPGKEYASDEQPSCAETPSVAQDPADNTDEHGGIAPVVGNDGTEDGNVTKRTSGPASRQLREVRVADLKPNPFNSEVFVDSLAGESIGALADDIKRNELRVPIEVNEDHLILDGHRRWLALQAVGIDTTYVKVVPGVTSEDDIKAYLLDAFSSFRNKPTYREKVRLFRLAMEVLGKRHGRPPGRPGENSSQNGTGFWSSDKVKREAAKLTSFGSYSTANRAEYVVLNADQETLRALDAGEITVNVAYNRIRAEKRKAESGASGQSTGTDEAASGREHDDGAFAEPEMDDTSGSTGSGDPGTAESTASDTAQLRGQQYTDSTCPPVDTQPETAADGNQPPDGHSEAQECPVLRPPTDPSDRSTESAVDAVGASASTEEPTVGRDSGEEDAAAVASRRTEPDTATTARADTAAPASKTDEPEKASHDAEEMTTQIEERAGGVTARVTCIDPLERLMEITTRSGRGAVRDAIERLAAASGLTAVAGNAGGEFLAENGLVDLLAESFEILCQEDAQMADSWLDTLNIKLGYILHRRQAEKLPPFDGTERGPEEGVEKRFLPADVRDRYIEELGQYDWFYVDKLIGLVAEHVGLAFFRLGSTPRESLVILHTVAVELAGRLTSGDASWAKGWMVRHTDGLNEVLEKATT